MPINTHPVSQQDVMAYLDGELSGVAAAEMASHLATCRSCQETAADLQSVSRNLSTWSADVMEINEIPANIATALDAREKSQPKRRFFSLTTLHRYSLPLAGLTVVVLILPMLIWVRNDRVNPSTRRKIELADSLRAESAGDNLSSQVAAPSQSSPSEPLRSDKAQSVPPKVVRTAELRLTAHSFETVRPDVARILLQFGGHVANLNISSPNGAARTLSATLRVPSPQLDGFLNEIRKLGHVDGESQHGEEVTQQSIDLEARLANARHTEERLTQILATRTGKLSDVLEVEEKLSEVRGQIEQAEAEEKDLNNRISFATVTLEVTEDYRTPLAENTPSVSRRLRNAAVNGLHEAFNMIVGLMAALLSIGPTILLLALILCLPGYWFWKKFRS